MKNTSVIWSPMETAPKDARILVHDGNRMCFVVWAKVHTYNEARDRWQYLDGWAVADSYNEERSVYMDAVESPLGWCIPAFPRTQGTR